VLRAAGLYTVTVDMFVGTSIIGLALYWVWRILRREYANRGSRKLLSEDFDASVASLSNLLSESDTPLRESLESSKLDLSLISLREVEHYLDKVREKRGDLTDEQFYKVILRCGAYTGEVIKKNFSLKRTWVSREDFVKRHPEMREAVPESLGAAAVLFAEPDSYAFPFGKVMKFIDNGSEDSLYFFAQVIGSPEVHA
jgi:hypothetical protein